MEHNIQGMPQNMYTQIIAALLIKFCPEKETALTMEEIGNADGCLVYAENGKIIVKGFENG